ncbi:MAG: OsmC family protein [Saprospiraceae bacterium]
MDNITASIGKEHYAVEIKSPGGNVVIADEPVTNGGQDLGFAPQELLIASLAACTSVTLRMYADRKGWDLEKVLVNISLERDETGTKTIINRQLQFEGTLDAKQRERLVAIANICPVHKILSQPIEIVTSGDKGSVIW